MWAFIFGALLIITLYFFIVRPVLKTAPILSTLFAQEASYMTQLRVKLVGWKTRILSRVTIIGSTFVGLYDFALPYVTGQDWTPITAKVPPIVWPFIGVGMGLLVAWARRATEQAPLIVTQDLTGSGEKVVVGMVLQK